MIVGAVFAVIAAGLAFADGSIDHVLRAWVLGLLLTFGWSVGGLALLMVQYCSGGKWGLLLRRPLEAMSRTLPLVFVYWVVTVFFMKRLYLWALYTNPTATAAALKAGLITEIQAHCLDFKRPMLNPATYIGVLLLCFAIWFFYMWRLHVPWQAARFRIAGHHSLLDQEVREHQRPRHRGLFADHDGGVIYWVMSMDVTWFSSVYGLLFLVGQGYSVLALGIIVSIALSKAEPFKTILRQTEQHDLGKFTFAFVMLNIYLGLRPVPHHLVGQSARRDSLVPRSHSRPLGHHHHPRLHLPLADSVLAAALARHQAQQEAADPGVPVDDLRQGLRSVLAD